jgi:hypothetical protein
MRRKVCSQGSTSAFIDAAIATIKLVLHQPVIGRNGMNCSRDRPSGGGAYMVGQ